MENLVSFGHLKRLRMLVIRDSARRLAWIAGLKAAVLVVALVAIRSFLVGHEHNVQFESQAIQPVGDAAYWARTTQRTWPFVSAGDTNEAPFRSKAQLSEDGRPLGPAHSLHEMIRRDGLGAFSHWGTDVLFSSSDNSDPRTNGRSYVFADRLFLSPSAAAPLAALAIAIIIRELLRLQRMLSWNGSIYRGLKSVYRYLGLCWALRNVLPGALASLVLLCFFALGAEAYMRWTAPFTKTSWPSQFVPDIGFTFKPYSVVRHTNHSTFWLEEASNSLGFLDREPPSEPPNLNTCRIVFLGDSFVEAAQVPVKHKFHVLFEQAFNQQSRERKVEAIAFGFSGTGQINQIPFYDRFARALKPRVVVLVIVSNDLANNSGLLEALRNGWDPNQPPRLFAKRDAKGEVVFQNIDSAWQKYVRMNLPPAREGYLPAFHASLVGKSLAYRWAYALLSRHYPAAATTLSGQPSYYDRLAASFAYFRNREDTRDQLEGWTDDTIRNIDSEFSKPDPLLPAFEEAIAFTDFALAELQRRAKRDGVRLFGFTTSTLTSPKLGSRYLERVQTLLRKNGIDEIDQTEFSRQKGYDFLDSVFKNDGHWSEIGHRRTAEQLTEYFRSRPEFCTP